MADCCFVCHKKDTELHLNKDMDTNVYCEQCLDAYNLQRFYRPQYDPDARVNIEYQYVPEFDRKRKRWTTENMQPLHLPQTASFEHKQTQDQTILQLARLPRDDTTYAADALQKKHPHAKDTMVRLDETNGRHDYYVLVDGKEESEYLQSTSGMIHDVFPKQVCKPMDLLFGEKPTMWNHEICKHYFNEAKIAELKQFATEVLAPLQQHNGSKYDHQAFTDKILGSRQWGPNHPKHGKYFSPDHNQLVQNLKQMHVDWNQKADDGRTRGTFVHQLIEQDLNGVIDLATHPIYSNPNLNHIQQYLAWKRTHFEPFFEPYRTEMRLCDTDEQLKSQYRRVGTCDLIAVPKNHPPPSETGGILRIKLIDWKNTIIEKHSFFERGKGHRMGVGPMCHVEDCNLRHYELQQADYQRMLMKFYKNFSYNGHVYDRVEFLGRELVCFDDTNPDNKAIVLALDNKYELELDMIWARRKQDVDEWLKQRHLPKPPKIYANLTDAQYSYLLLHLVRKNELFAQIIKDDIAKKHTNTTNTTPQPAQTHVF